MSPSLIVMTLALLLGLQPITTDLYLPSLPALTLELRASMSQAQLTLTALMLAFGVSQLFWGPLSDRYGRRPVLLLGMLTYVLASVSSAFSSTMNMLIVWRILQGVAMGAAVMCARAIVRDLYEPAEGASVMSKGLSGLGVIACVSAPFGGLVTQWFDWPAAFMTLSVFGAMCLCLITFRFEETLPHKNPKALEVGTLVSTWIDVLSNSKFLAFTALSTFAYSGLFTFLASSSFVFIGVLGLTTTQYGLVMFANSFVYLLGTFLCRRLLMHYGVRRAVGIAGVLSLSGGTAMVALWVAGVQSVWAVELPFLFFMLGHGIHNPCGQSGAVAPFPRAAGAASALNGFIAMICTFATGQWLGTHMDGTTSPLIFGIFFWSILIALSAWTAVQRYGRL
jgi:DHA1 family bicyclomycin/chloramphenicol resistance-like MFS transporter